MPQKQRLKRPLLKRLKNYIQIKILIQKLRMNLLKFQKLIKLSEMSKKEKFMMSMECLQMNKRVMKIWDSMEIKAVFQIFRDSAISGVDKTKAKVDSRVFLVTLKICSEVRNPRDPIGLLEEKISFFI
jgi:hypothetical protein